ncbi:hypothetical protein AUC43_15220 [Hymenobacter sedentarius]|uniref:HNH nuclease domain-containing protein n=1 Tax=Hymenobacter sedentarius TaxID=1411621 RepID=A0A0U4CDU7_9BACT|nr:hypothetical protein AUC43_15220 [Hymenobacter sedentarius]
MGTLSPLLEPFPSEVHESINSIYGPRALWPEHEWKDVPGFPNYQASSGGLVWSNDAETLCHLYSDKKGGNMVKLVNGYDQTWMVVPKLIASCFVPNANLRNSYVVHINGVRTDNRAANLRWAHRSELTLELQAVTDKRLKMGPGDSPFHLSKEDVQFIREGNAAGVSSYVLAREFGVSRTTILSLLRGDTHRFRN